MNKQDYLDNLANFIHQPEDFAFDDNIIPVAMWLRNYIPGDDDMSPHNMSSAAIQARMCDIVDVKLNDITRLMILNGYSLGGANQTTPEWLMEPIGDI